MRFAHARATRSVGDVETVLERVIGFFRPK
jgi:hypothetical protein